MTAASRSASSDRTIDPERTEHPAPLPWKRRAAAALAGAMLASISAEIVVRQIYYVPWEIDPEFGCIVKPGTTARYRLEGNGVSRWTANGVRAAAPVDPARKPILVLGDSFTEAYQVSDEDTYTRCLESELRASAIEAPVVNAGRSGASPADYVADVERNVRRFNPRWVVVQLNEEDLTGDAWRADKAHFSFEHGRLVANPAPPKAQSAIARFVWSARQRSALLNYGIIRLQQFARAFDTAPPLFSAAGPRPADGEPCSYADVDVAAQLGAVATAYRDRVTFLLLLPFDPFVPMRRTSVEEAFRTACRFHGWSCLSLRSEYDRFAAEHTSPYGFPNSGFNVGHMNPLGHKVAADLLARELRRLHTDALL